MLSYIQKLQRGESFSNSSPKSPTPSTHPLTTTAPVSEDDLDTEYEVARRQDTIKAYQEFLYRHKAVIAMYGVHHELESGINNGTCLFGIESFNQRGGPFEIGTSPGLCPGPSPEPGPISHEMSCSFLYATKEPSPRSQQK